MPIASNTEIPSSLLTSYLNKKKYITKEGGCPLLAINRYPPACSVLTSYLNNRKYITKEGSVDLC